MDPEPESKKPIEKTEEVVVEKTEGIGEENMEPTPERKSGKKLAFAVIILIVAFLGAGFFFKSKINSLLSGGGVKPLPSNTQTPEPQPSPTPNQLVRSDWSLQVLNGSGESGLAKIIATKIAALGYSVVKVGNADNSDFAKTEIQVKADLADKIELVIADLKDIIKIASQGAELKDSTASARIIIGKDSI